MKLVAKREDEALLRFDKGEELLSVLRDFCNAEGIEGAFFNGLGGATEVTLSHYVLSDKNYEPRHYTGDLEVASIIGNISRDGGDVVIHAHATIGLDSLEAVAGHVGKLVVAGTCEINLEFWREGLRRSYDEKTGLSLLSSEDEQVGT